MKQLFIALAIAGTIALASCGGSHGTPTTKTDSSVHVSTDTSHVTVDTLKKDSVKK